MTAHVDSKFGGIDDERKRNCGFDSNLRKQKNSNLSFDGLHAHIGSQIFDKNAFVAEIEKMFGFVKKLESDYGIHLNTIDLGGGFAATYTSEDHPIPLDEVL